MSSAKNQSASLREIFTRDFLIVSMISFTAFFGFQMVNVGLPVYMEQLGAKAHVIGLATTLMTVTATAMRVFSGALLDRFGRVGALVAGAAIMACSIAAYAIFPIVGVILGLRMLHGIGWGMGSTASSTMAADIIPKHRFAEGMGYFAMTTAISSAIAPAISIELVHQTGALSMLYVAAGVTVVSFAFSVVQLFITRRRGAGEVVVSMDKPAGSTAVPDVGNVAAAGSDTGDVDRTTARAAAPASATDVEKAGDAPGPGPTPISKLETFFDRRAVFPGLFMLSVNIGFGCITTFIALHGAQQGIGNVSLYFLLYAIVTIVGRPLIGKLIDMYGYRRPAIFALLCTTGTLALIGLATNTAMLVAAGALAGLGIGTAMGVFQAMAVARVEPYRRGVATSTYMTLFDLGIALGSLLGGAVAGAFGYSCMYLASALFPLAASFVAAATIRKGDGISAPKGQG